MRHSLLSNAMSSHTVRFRFATSHWCGIRFFSNAMSPHTVRFRFATSHWCGIRRITKKGTGSFWKQAFSRTCSFFGVCGLIAYAQKSTIPVVALQKRYPQMRDQGLEPWTPWLRVIIYVLCFLSSSVYKYYFYYW